MARNKYPEETRKKILAVARDLFYEKGYDNTTIQDIIDGLGGLTKGVIYHHFKSKNDILEQVIETLGVPDEQGNWYENWQGETGLEKIRLQLLKSLQTFERYAILYSAEVLLKSPRMIGEAYLSSLNEGAGYLQVYIDEGIADGSIVTEFPKELSEFVCLTMDVWFGLNIVRYSREELENKMRFLQHIFQSIQVPIIDETILNAAFNLYDYIQSRR
ncbi:TetR/AcrR family transcriptional regulator [Isobaculum melis]|uniref:DNA-binding transcriptional regulator, AcrR family n=1 Tax=Isobaculum melis TaxID=142588 RepID=A0A1H9Q4N5_9LACT|nr:TetR/AcrR family transcriptional regulator [Isobaculum melis]SER55400.1 DNA-binding transcriptional regulator, AcrR family [Isobaculum melis]